MLKVLLDICCLADYYIRANAMFNESTKGIGLLKSTWGGGAGVSENFIPGHA